MDQPDVNPEDVDELWDPDALRRDLLAMTMAERLEIVALLFRQTQIFEELRARPR